MPKGLEGEIASNNPNPMTAEAGIVQGKWSAMKDQAHVLHLSLLFLQAEGQTGWTTHPNQSGNSSYVHFRGTGEI